MIGVWAVRTAYSRARPDVTIHIFPNTDHEFMSDTVGDPEGYAKLKLPHQMQPIVVGIVVEWLVSRLK
jgi:hypothetical protein